MINWRKPDIGNILSRWKQPLSRTLLSRTWALLKLLYIPQRVGGHSFKRELGVAAMLGADRTDEACRRAIHKLMIAGLHPFPVQYHETALPAERLLASLIIPVRNEELIEKLVLQNKNAKGDSNV